MVELFSRNVSFEFFTHFFKRILLSPMLIIDRINDFSFLININNPISNDFFVLIIFWMAVLLKILYFYCSNLLRSRGSFIFYDILNESIEGTHDILHYIFLIGFFDFLKDWFMLATWRRYGNVNTIRLSSQLKFFKLFWFLKAN